MVFGIPQVDAVTSITCPEYRSRAQTDFQVFLLPVRAGIEAVAEVRATGRSSANRRGLKYTQSAKVVRTKRRRSCQLQSARRNRLWAKQGCRPPNSSQRKVSWKLREKETDSYEPLPNELLNLE